MCNVGAEKSWGEYPKKIILSIYWIILDFFYFFFLSNFARVFFGESFWVCGGVCKKKVIFFFLF